jgi:serpin B
MPPLYLAIVLLLSATLSNAATPRTDKKDAPVNAFAVSLYQKLAKPDQNLFFSPFSIASALAITSEGARAQTADELAHALSLRDPNQLPELHQALAQISKRLTPAPVSPLTLQQLASLRLQLATLNRELEETKEFDDRYFAKYHRAQSLAGQINQLQRELNPFEFRSANALWVEQSFKLERPFLDALDRHYQSAGAKLVEFIANPEVARKSINEWVSAQTHARITELLKPQMVGPDTRLILTNAVYFLGEWPVPFDPQLSKEANFSLSSGSTVKANLMHDASVAPARYAAFGANGTEFDTPMQIPARAAMTQSHYPKDGLQILELPYKGDAISLLIILPQRADQLGAIESQLSATQISKWYGALKAREVSVYLPKFKLRSEFELSDALRKLGVKRAFVNPMDAKNGAQFDGISASSDPAKRLYIGAVVHQSFVEVNEKGTEAAAATAVIALAGAAMPTMLPFTPEVRADRPFLFAIMDRQSATVLFLGKLERPE